MDWNSPLGQASSYVYVKVRDSDQYILLMKPSRLNISICFTADLIYCYSASTYWLISGVFLWYPMLELSIMNHTKSGFTFSFLICSILNLSPKSLWIAFPCFARVLRRRSVQLAGTGTVCAYLLTYIIFTLHGVIACDRVIHFPLLCCVCRLQETKMGHHLRDITGV